jgi:predicted HicB family RNase H-like nuclease
MKNMMEYKGYYGSVNYNDEDQIFYGKVEFIRSLISYDGYDVNSLRNNFQEAIDDYLQLCLEIERQPEQSFQGSFNIAIGSQLHRLAVMTAQEKGINLDTLIRDALVNYLIPNSEINTMNITLKN